MSRLPIIVAAGRQFFHDERLKECRDVNNPHRAFKVNGQYDGSEEVSLLSPLLTKCIEHEPNVGFYAKSIESGWIGRIEAVEIQGDDVFYRMKGVDTLVMAIAGAELEDCLCDDDIQWFVPNDVKIF